MTLILQPQIQQRLCTDEMAWLVTVRPDGRPHSVPVWFLWEQTTILIWSKPNTQKIRNLHHNPAITFTLDDTKKGSDVVILEGTAALLEQGEGREAISAYGEKYREGLQRIGVTAEQFCTFYSQPIRLTKLRLITGR